MIAEKIKALREARGWSQAELSRRLGITRNGVNSWEQGLSMPSPACLVDLAKVFGVSTDYLLGLERLTTVDVTGLADRDVAVLAELAERLKNCKDWHSGSLFVGRFFVLDFIHLLVYNQSTLNGGAAL